MIIKETRYEVCDDDMNKLHIKKENAKYKKL